jgi:hypothetical protein
MIFQGCGWPQGKKENSFLKLSTAHVHENIGGEYLS